MTIAARTGASGLSWLIGDQQGTDSVAIDARTLGVTRRYYDQFGNTRVTPASSFAAGEKGFIGGVADKATGLVDLGAREYQPGTESFISTDPILKPYDPQDLNPYAYAKGNPATLSDPSGTAPQGNCPRGVEKCDSGPCFVAVGIVNIPCNYNGGDAGQILAIYDKFKKYPPDSGKNPESDFSALRDACTERPKVCGPKLTKLLVAAGPFGIAGAGNGTGSSAGNMASEQLLNNAVGITGQLSGGSSSNNPIGKMGEMATEARLKAEGYQVQEQVSFRTADGVKFRVDFISLKDGEYVGWEVKTEAEGRSARLEGGQLEGYDALSRGEEVYPFGTNAEAIGLRPGVGIWFRMEFDIWDRPEGM